MGFDVRGRRVLPQRKALAAARPEHQRHDAGGMLRRISISGSIDLHGCPTGEKQIRPMREALRLRPRRTGRSYAICTPARQRV
jgi:hypothetical protein